MTGFLERCRRHFQAARPLVVGFAGGSGSGKTTLAQQLHTLLGAELSGVLMQDSFYIDQSARFDGDGNGVNFDHPSSLDFALMEQHLEALQQGRSVRVPIYDFATHQRRTETVHFEARPVVIVDGTLILEAAGVRRHLGVSVFVETSERARYARRLERDVRERGRTPEGVERQFLRHVKPMHDQFVEPSKAQAHVCVSGEQDLELALGQVLTVIEDRMLRVGAEVAD